MLVISENGELSKLIFIQTDCTQRKLKENYLLKVLQELVKQSQAHQDFSFGISHNLRYFKANTIGLSGTLSRVNKNPDVLNKTINKINRSAHNRDTVIRHLNHVISIGDTDTKLAYEVLLHI